MNTWTTKYSSYNTNKPFEFKDIDGSNTKRVEYFNYLGALIDRGANM